MKKEKIITLIYIVFLFVILLGVTIIYITSSNLVAVIVALILLAINIVSYLIYRNNKKTIQKELKECSNVFDRAYKNNLAILPFPTIMINEEGEIVWLNSMYAEIYNKETKLPIKVADLFEGGEDLVSLDKNYYRDVMIDGNYFDLYLNKLPKDDKDDSEISIIYFVSTMERHMLQTEVKQKKVVSMIIEIDNLEEVLKVTEEEKKPILKAEIEKRIITYAHKMNAIIKKYHRNRYIMVLEYANIAKQIKDKFSILDHIREIEITNKLAVTLSIGVGASGNNPLETYNNALDAIDLALGRGGDQAVLKDGDKLTFFGGKTKEVEKRTKVKSRIIGYGLRDLVEESSKIYIMGHVNPDMDAIGSAIGLNSVIRSMGKESYIVLDSVNSSIESIVNKFLEVPSNKDVFIKSENVLAGCNKDDLLILVDINNKGYVMNKDIVEAIPKIVIIDHHRKAVNSIENPVLSYIETYASSTSELVSEVIPYLKENYRIGTIEAEALLAGITVDTKNFTFKTGVRTFEAAAYLRSLGADTIDIKKLFANDFDLVIKRYDIIREAEINGDIAIVKCSSVMEDGLVVAQAADELLNIAGVKASFVLAKIDNGVNISARSFGDINVQLILESIGGGGHLTMAGARVENLNIEEVYEIIKELIDRYLQEGEK